MAPEAPHIVFTLVDDWSWEIWPRERSFAASHDQREADVQQQQQQRAWHLLPNVAQLLVDDGMSLDHHYTYRVCAPTRRSLLSGRLPIHISTSNTNCPGIPTQMATIADTLKGAGYRTAFIGKWNVGLANTEHMPWRRGFDESLGFLKHATDHYQHTAEDSSESTARSTVYRLHSTL